MDEGEWALAPQHRNPKLEGVADVGEFSCKSQPFACGIGFCALQLLGYEAGQAA